MAEWFNKMNFNEKGISIKIFQKLMGILARAERFQVSGDY